MQNTVTPFSPRPGQMAISLVITVLLFLLLMFPVIDMFVKNEAKWSIKEKQSSEAFHLAEAGIDRARWKLLENNVYWVMTGTGTLAGYNFDQVYTSEGRSGTYTIKISSDPTDADKRIVESVGRDAANREVRRIKAVLLNDNSADFATRAANRVANEGGAANNHIEWGQVISGNTIETCIGGGTCTAASANYRKFPRYYSAGHVTPQDGGSTAASTNDIYWWSYYEVPPFPDLDFEAYLDSATASGNAPSGCGAVGAHSYHIQNAGGATAVFKGCTDTSGKTYYIDGHAEFKDGSGGNFIVGTIIVLGNVTISGGGGGSASYAANVPPEAWKEYGGDWNYYKTNFDPFCPHDTYAEAVAANYRPTTLTKTLNNILLHGFLYTGGNQGLQGGGNCNIHGALLSNRDATMGTSSMKIYYDNTVTEGLLISSLNIKLFSWYEVKGEWPPVP